MASHKIDRKGRESLKAYWQTLAQGQFTGYVMMSNGPIKYAFTSPSNLPSWETLHADHNFIWEANLYEENKRSISIQPCNDQWQVVEIAWGGSPSREKGDFIDHEYILRLPEGEEKMTEKVCTIKEAWLPVEDELCENKDVLKPAWTAFVGFKKEGENK